jgi:predicted ATPase
MRTDHLFVVTGGPGSGKSSLITALAEQGIATMPEAGRAIIQDQVAIGGDALPWADRAGFAGQMLDWELRSHGEARVLPGPVLLDRGIPDVIGYLRLCGLPVPEHAERAAVAFRYNRTVFIAPHWPAIYAPDAERKQDEAEAAATQAMMARVYAELGYDLVPLPLASVAERVRFVTERLRL